MEKPPYKINKKILDLIAEISRALGKLEGLLLLESSPKLRKKNRIKTIHGTLTIEGNELGIEKITDILDDKKVLAPKKDIIEVRNAIKAYKNILDFDFKSEKSFLKAHSTLMQDLIENSGRYRSCNVGVLAGSKVVHMAPQPKFVPQLMQTLFKYLSSYEENLLIKSCVFHYELEFIHPFNDGNGRIGRFWQTLILTKFDKTFEFIPIESIVHKKQQKYYEVLLKCDKEGDSTVFIEFMLKAILEAIDETLNYSQPINLDDEDRLKIAQEKLQGQSFTRKDYINIFKNISTATANRDLKEGVKQKIFSKTGDKRNTKYKVI